MPSWVRMRSDTNITDLGWNNILLRKTKKIIYNIMKPILTEIVESQYYEKTI